MTAWLLDTGPLVSFFDKSDKYHSWAVRQWSRAPIPLLTCEAVLAEATYLLATHAKLPPEKVLELFDRGVISVLFRLEEQSETIARLLEKYRDREMQLADACLVRLAELKRDCWVFTLDKSDFQVYRRFDRQVIPLVAPD